MTNPDDLQKIVNTILDEDARCELANLFAIALDAEAVEEKNFLEFVNDHIYDLPPKAVEVWKANKEKFEV